MRQKKWQDILVAQDSHNSIPNFGLLKTSQMYGLTVLGLEVQNQDVRKAMLSDGSRRESFLASSSFWYLLAIVSVPCPVDVPLKVVFSFCAFTSSSLFMCLSLCQTAAFEKERVMWDQNPP